MRHDFTLSLLSAEQAHPALFRAKLAQQLVLRGALSVGFRHDTADLHVTVVWGDQQANDPRLAVGTVRRWDFPRALAADVARADAILDYRTEVRASDPATLRVTES